jgi:hypothetical protein
MVCSLTIDEFTFPFSSKLLSQDSFARSRFANHHKTSRFGSQKALLSLHIKLRKQMKSSNSKTEKTLFVMVPRLHQTDLVSNSRPMFSVSV